VTQESKSNSRQPTLLIDSEVAREIRQHAHSSRKAEICGVLIGQDRGGVVKVEASITGLNAEEAGAHVTFTQDTWEHIYRVKDRKFPDARIVGWYHSHPGFGVFLSEHDTFIHTNFFSSPGQVAWVVDPHSDEEGCFGWVGGRIERLTQIAVIDRRGGEHADESSRPEPSFSARSDKDVELSYEPKPAEVSGEGLDSTSLRRLVGTIFSCLTALVVGVLLAWYVFPRVVVVPVPVDPQTGQPLTGANEDSRAPSAGPDKAKSGTDPNARDEGTERPSQTDNSRSNAKGDHAQPK
jgi:proteasome lid subunit RPN8/RPN11